MRAVEQSDLAPTDLVDIYFCCAGMFTYEQKAKAYWFSSAQCENYQEFNLVGVVSF